MLKKSFAATNLLDVPGDTPLRVSLRVCCILATTAAAAAAGPPPQIPSDTAGQREACFEVSDVDSLATVMHLKSLLEPQLYHHYIKYMEPSPPPRGHGSGFDGLAGSDVDPNADPDAHELEWSASLLRQRNIRYYARATSPTSATSDSDYDSFDDQLPPLQLLLQESPPHRVANPWNRNGDKRLFLRACDFYATDGRLMADTEPLYKYRLRDDQRIDCRIRLDLLTQP